MTRSLLQLLATLLSSAAYAQSPDLSFATAGQFAYTTAQWEEFQDVAVMDDGRTVLVGTSISDTGSELRVVRLLANGTPDPAFSGDGAVFIALGDGNTEGIAVAVLADGRIVATGTTEQAGARHMCAERLLANGDPDPAFGSGGAFISSVDVGGEHLLCMAVQADGRLLLGGDVITATSTRACIIRLTTGGALDGSFGDGGVVEHNAFGGTELMTVNTMALDANDQVVAAGVTYLSSNNDVFVLRLLTDGGLDPAYGTGGETVITENGSDEYASAMTIAPNGDCYLAGSRFGIGGDDLVFYHFAADGTQLNFGGDLMWQLVADGSEYTDHILLDPGGDLMVACTAYDMDGLAHAQVLRVTTDAALDATFGTGGRLEITALANSAANSLLLQPDGKLVVAGNSYPAEGNSEGLVARYNSLWSGIAELQDDVNAALAPNPCEGRFTLTAQGQAIDRLQLLDASGRVVFDDRFTLLDGGARTVELPQSVAPGVYAAALFSGTRRAVQRLVVR